MFPLAQVRTSAYAVNGIGIIIQIGFLFQRQASAPMRET